MDYEKILKDLIAIDTSMPPGNNYGKLVDYLAPLFEGVGFKTERIKIPPEQAEGRDGRVNLICHRRSPGRPRLIFYGHMDVVPAEGWPAFKPRTAGGKVFGRGSADMKGALPGLLVALEKCAGQELLYDVSVMVTTDEEVSQGSQLRYLAQYLQPLRQALVFDLDSNFGYVSIAGLGALQFDIIVTGKSVHSGLSHLGKNAVEDAIPVLAALSKLKKRLKARKSSVPAAPETGLTNMVPRLNINMIKGGLKVNIVPDECIISVDRRLIPEENADAAYDEIVSALEAIPASAGVQWKMANQFIIPTVPASRSGAIERLVSIQKEVTGEGGKYGEMGSGDLKSIVVNEWGGEEFGLGVIRTASNIHGRDEYVNLEDIEDLGEIIFRFLTEK
jgi:succinyl-diaminopimelate desuccinylase